MRRDTELRIRRVLLATVLAWLTFCALQAGISVNPASRLATLEALVHHGTWTLDATRFGRMTVDRVQWEGAFYSSKPPLLPTLLAPVYALALALGLPSLPDDPSAAATGLRIPFALLPWLLAAVLFHRLLDRTIRDPLVRVWGSAAWVLGGYATVWGATFDNHSFATVAILGALTLWLPPPAPGEDVADPPSIAHTSGRRIAGAALLGLSGAFDLGALPTGGLMTLTLAGWTLHERRPVVALAVLAAFATPTLAQSALQWAIAGTPRPFYLVAAAYDYPGSYWNAPAEFDRLHEPWYVYLTHALAGHHGLFSHTPWLLLALPAAGVLARAPARVRALALAWAIGAVVTVVTYVVRTSNYGGRCVGMRWWLVLHPMLALLAVVAVDRLPAVRRRPLLLGALVGWSALLALPAAVAPWEESLPHAMLRAVGWGSVPG